MKLQLYATMDRNCDGQFNYVPKQSLCCLCTECVKHLFFIYCYDWKFLIAERFVVNSGTNPNEKLCCKYCDQCY